MNYSSKKQLVQETNEVLLQIRKELYNSSLDKKIISESFFKNLVDSITSIIIDKYLKKRQSYYYKKIPYLVGLDLVNNKNLKINKKYLDKLEVLILEIIQDINSSPILSSAIQELESQKMIVDSIQSILNHTSIYSKKEYNKMKKMHDDAVNKYNKILKEKITKIIESILTIKRYSNFEQVITYNLSKGIQGISPQELNNVRNNYINVVAKRASEYINKNKIKPYLTPYEIRNREDTE
jgi:hypothetical protein